MHKHFTTAAIAAFCLIGLLSGTANAEDSQTTIDVWTKTAPGEDANSSLKEKVTTSKKDGVIRITNVTKPTITIFRPIGEKKTKAAVLVCPGGGYNILAYNKEGTEIAEWLNSIGVTAIVLKYRVPRRPNLPKHLAPLQDAQRAMRLVRSKAKELEIDPQKIGVLGFSAGGHLSAMLSTSFEKDAYKPMDDIDKLSSRPDFTVLVYPAYMFEGEKLKEEFQVTKKTPPALMIHANNDPYSSISSVMYYMALKKVGVPTAMHIFSDGGHGFGLKKKSLSSGVWPKLAAAWFKSQKLLEK